LSWKVCRPIFERFLFEAVANGRVPLKGFMRDHGMRRAYSLAIWKGDAPSQIDPVKEVEAAAKRINLGLSTVDEETTALTGGDFERNISRIRKERKILEEIGLWVPGMPAK
jgi:capsid protein